MKKIDQQEAERAKELKKLAQNPCYNHTQCGEDCLPDCPHYAEKRLDMVKSIADISHLIVGEAEVIEEGVGK